MKKYMLLSALVLCLTMSFTLLRDLVAKGTVTDEQGHAIASASVLVEGSKLRTVTDQQGKFFLPVNGKKATLLITAAGYEQARVQVENDKEILVRLKRSSHSLSEVVIVGYGKKRKADAGIAMGAVTVDRVPGLSVSPATSAYEFKQGEGRNDLMNLEGYDNIQENAFLKVTDNPLSTFSIDVDGASYSNIRRMLNSEQLPPAGAVRIEEMINYFTYAYPQPSGDAPFTINTEIAACPWNGAHRLVSIGLQGRKVPVANLPASNLTFLIDVSGSMAEEDKLPLVKASLHLLTGQLRPQDKVSIVVYAGNAGLVLPPTQGDEKRTILDALDRLQAGGSTAGGQGIQLAYKTARQNFVPNGNNRVILCTDGDFNVGQSSDDELERMIETERKSGVFLTVLGFGTGNYQDAKMQKLADKGNGNHAYIDNQNEARKVLVNEFGGTLFTIAKDVKLQVEFNPLKVQGYRLIGYENRMLAKEDFNNDKKDAGELGSGHTVTALYEIIPAGTKSPELETVDKLKYQVPAAKTAPVAFGGELLNIKLRYKQPDGNTSKLLEHPVSDSRADIGTASENLRFAAAVAELGMLLRNSSFKANSSFPDAERLAAGSATYDPEGYRREFLNLLRKAQKLSKQVALNDK